jgi:predicted lipoprotein with Yx(FWY)xxD motif
MQTLLASFVACATLVFGVAACGDDDNSSGSAPAAETSTAATTTTTGRDASTSKRRRGTAIKVMNSRYGRMIFDGRGRAIYLFTRERGSRSRCYGECAVAWPPVYTRGKPRARAGVDADLLGTTKRRGGRRQVTYNGHPLYYYEGDNAPGETAGQGMNVFGALWYVVSPAGIAR